jgi:hypothetical protein
MFHHDSDDTDLELAYGTNVAVRIDGFRPYGSVAAWNRDRSDWGLELGLELFRLRLDYVTVPAGAWNSCSSKSGGSSGPPAGV